MCKPTAITIASFILITIVHFSAYAQDNHTISHQGFLTDEAGEPVEDDSYIFTFRIYDDETDGDELWSENQVLQINNGVFNAQLGSEEPLDLPFDEPYWIGVEIDGGDELDPRMPLSATPYAMHALSVEDGAITGAKIDSAAIQAGENVTIEQDEQDNFIISADSPEQGLTEVAGDTTLKGDGTDEAPLGLDFSEIIFSGENLADDITIETTGNIDAAAFSGDGSALTGIVADELAPESVGEEELADQAVTGTKLQEQVLQPGSNVSVDRDEDDNFVISADTPDDGLMSVSSDATLSGDGTDEAPLGLADQAVTSVKLAPEAVGTSQLTNQAVTAPKLDPMDASAGQVLSWDGSNWGPEDIEESNWSVNNDDIHFTGGNVGIGITSPSQSLEVDGNVQVDGWIGTAEDATVELRIYDKEAFRIETPWDPEDTPNLVAGHEDNTIAGGASAATISGGGIDEGHNEITGLGDYATLAGGHSNLVSSRDATISGGVGNEADGLGSVIAGGTTNFTEGIRAVIGGGIDNTAEGNYEVIAGGRDNLASGGEGAIGGGSENVVSERWATVAGGEENQATARYATVAGGNNNVASGERSFAAGRWAVANHDGAFVWNSAGTSFFSETEDEFAVRSDGGVRFRVGNITCIIDDGEGGWVCSSVSDRNQKHNIKKVDTGKLLDKVNELPVTTYSYNSDDSSVRHLGPMAQDFSEIFELGSDETRIRALNVAGVGLAAVQGLYEKLQEEQDRIRELEAEIAELREKVEETEDLKERLTRIEKLIELDQDYAEEDIRQHIAD